MNRPPVRRREQRSHLLRIGRDIRHELAHGSHDIVIDDSRNICFEVTRSFGLLPKLRAPRCFLSWWNTHGESGGKASRDALAVTIAEAADEWLTSGEANMLAEQIPAVLLTDDARLQAPPAPIPATDLTPASLPEVWSGDSTTALAIAVALSKKASTNLPWPTVRDVIDGAIRARMVEPTLDSAAWPCDFAGAQNVKLRVPAGPQKPIEVPFTLRPNVLTAEAELRPSEIQNLAEQLPEIRKAVGAAVLKFRICLELDGHGKSTAQDIVAKLNDLLAKISKGLLLK